MGTLPCISRAPGASIKEMTRYDLEREERDLESAWSTAMESSEYVAEMLHIESEFAVADAESARQIQ